MKKCVVLNQPQKKIILKEDNYSKKQFFLIDILNFICYIIYIIILYMYCKEESKCHENKN